MLRNLEPQVSVRARYAGRFSAAGAAYRVPHLLGAGSVLALVSGTAANLTLSNGVVNIGVPIATGVQQRAIVRESNAYRAIEYPVTFDGDGAAQSVSISGDLSYLEGAAGTEREYVFTVSRSSAGPEVSVPVTFNRGTTDAEDYRGGVLPSLTFVTIPANATSANFSIFVRGDATVEATETASVTISAPSGYIAGSRMSSTMTIFNDDAYSAGTDPVVAMLPTITGTSGVVTGNAGTFDKGTVTSSWLADYIPVSTANTLDMSQYPGRQIRYRSVSTDSASGRKGYAVSAPIGGADPVTFRRDFATNSSTDTMASLGFTSWKNHPEVFNISDSLKELVITPASNNDTMVVDTGTAAHTLHFVVTKTPTTTRTPTMLVAATNVNNGVIFHVSYDADRSAHVISMGSIVNGQLNYFSPGGNWTYVPALQAKDKLSIKVYPDRSVSISVNGTAYEQVGFGNPPRPGPARQTIAEDVPVGGTFAGITTDYMYGGEGRLSGFQVEGKAAGSNFGISSALDDKVRPTASYGRRLDISGSYSGGTVTRVDVSVIDANGREILPRTQATLDSAANGIWQAKIGSHDLQGDYFEKGNLRVIAWRDGAAAKDGVVSNYVPYPWASVSQIGFGINVAGAPYYGSENPARDLITMSTLVMDSIGIDTPLNPKAPGAWTVEQTGIQPNLRVTKQPGNGLTYYLPWAMPPGSGGVYTIKHNYIGGSVFMSPTNKIYSNFKKIDNTTCEVTITPGTITSEEVNTAAQSFPSLSFAYGTLPAGEFAPTVIKKGDTQTTRTNEWFRKDMYDLADFIRFMIGIGTNDERGKIMDAADVPPETFLNNQGYSLVDCIKMCNETGRNLWLNIHHQYSTAGVRKVAEVVRDLLDPTLKVLIEYTNEPWNIVMFASGPFSIREGVRMGLYGNGNEAPLAVQDFAGQGPVYSSDGRYRPEHRWPAKTYAAGTMVFLGGPGFAPVWKAKQNVPIGEVGRIPESASEAATNAYWELFMTGYDEPKVQRRYLAVKSIETFDIFYDVFGSAAPRRLVRALFGQQVRGEFQHTLGQMLAFRDCWRKVDVCGCSSYVGETTSDGRRIALYDDTPYAELLETDVEAFKTRLFADFRDATEDGVILTLGGYKHAMEIWLRNTYPDYVQNSIKFATYEGGPVFQAGLNGFTGVTFKGDHTVYQRNPDKTFKLDAQGKRIPADTLLRDSNGSPILDANGKTQVDTNKLAHFDSNRGRWIEPDGTPSPDWNYKILERIWPEIRNDPRYGDVWKLFMDTMKEHIGGMWHANFCYAGPLHSIYGQGWEMILVTGDTTNPVYTAIRDFRLANPTDFKAPAATTPTTPVAGNGGGGGKAGA